jgi:hypothetical protein
LPRSLLALSIKDLEIPKEVSADIDLGEMLPPNITRLSLSDAGVWKSSSHAYVSVSGLHIPKIGQHLKHLEHLVLNNFLEVLPSLSWVPQGPLKTLEVHSGYRDGKLDNSSFNSLGPCKALTSLIIRSEDVSSLDYDFVKQLPPKLTNLTLPLAELSLAAWGDGKWLQLRSRCPHLKRFTVIGPYCSVEFNVMQYPRPSQLSLPTIKAIADSPMTSLKLNLKHSSHLPQAFPDTITHLTLCKNTRMISSSFPLLFPKLQILVLSQCSVTDDFLIALPPTTTSLSISEVVVTDPLRLNSRLKRDLIEIQDLDLVQALCPSVISIRAPPNRNSAEFEELTFITWTDYHRFTDEELFISALPQSLTSLRLPRLSDPASIPQLPLQLTYLDIYYAVDSWNYEKAPALPSTLKHLHWAFALKSREATGGTPPKGFFAWLPRGLETLVTNADNLNKPMVQQLPPGLTSLILPFLILKSSLAPALGSLPLKRLVVRYIENPKVLESFPKTLTELRSIMKLAPPTWKKLFALDLPLRYLPHEHCPELKAYCNFA